MGKTALALNVVQHAAIEHNVGIAIFSLEMSKEQLVQRLLCSEGLVDAQRLRRGQLRDDDRSEEHTSELQSLAYLVCRLLLEKKKRKQTAVCELVTSL